MSSLNPSSVLNRRLDASELATSHSYAFSSTEKLQPAEFPQQTPMLDVDVWLLHFLRVLRTVFPALCKKACTPTLTSV